MFPYLTYWGTLSLALAWLLCHGLQGPSSQCSVNKSKSLIVTISPQGLQRNEESDEEEDIADDEAPNEHGFSEEPPIEPDNAVDLLAAAMSILQTRQTRADDDDEVEGGEDDSTPGSAQHYLSRLHDPIFPGAKLSVLEYTYATLTEKLKTKGKDKACDRAARLHASAVFPEGNLCPPSLYMMKKVVNCKDAADIERHVCVCDQHLYEPLLRKDYRKHRYETCGKCGVSGVY